ncbi:hypothetical protein [Tumebacillus flagellatus]|uniref:Uncharacterized protein n=1 Tax=Tumebacillus flagellatus TaxID=1157490 RepID=A0A074LLP7_9BACL|nr:hypothetical protein [Tumebacillus flagellatus]KEO80803.1 hypothetical protein EL26_24345 [Tumebacillus flagellatus]
MKQPIAEELRRWANSLDGEEDGPDHALLTQASSLIDRLSADIALSGRVEETYRDDIRIRSEWIQHLEEQNQYLTNVIHEQAERVRKLMESAMEKDAEIMRLREAGENAAHELHNLYRRIEDAKREEHHEDCLEILNEIVIPWEVEPDADGS